jgi:hypothetical protein
VAKNAGKCARNYLIYINAKKTRCSWKEDFIAFKYRTNTQEVVELERNLPDKYLPDRVSEI